MDVRVGLWRRLSAEELMLLNCGVGKDSWESLGLQGDPTSPFWRRLALGFLCKNDAKAEAPVLWPAHEKSWLIGKDSDAGRDWGQEEKGTTEDEMAGWHHWLDGRESEWTSGVGDGQGGLACYDSWGRKESDTNERLNWTDRFVFLSQSRCSLIQERRSNYKNNTSWEPTICCELLPMLTDITSSLQSNLCILGLCICGINQPQIANICKKIPESSKKQNLNLLHAGNYLHRICIISGIICNLKVI